MATNFQTTPEQVRNGANRICEEGNIMTNELKKIYATIAKINAVWQGTAYNDLVNAFNGMVDTINPACSFVQYGVPTSLVLAMNNYLSADNSSEKLSDSFSAPIPIDRLSTGVTSPIKFDESVVETEKTNAAACFSKVINQLETIASIVDSLNWTGEAADTVKTVLKNYKDKLSNSFAEVNAQFQKSVDETRARFTSAENANTVMG